MNAIILWSPGTRPTHARCDLSLRHASTAFHPGLSRVVCPSCHVPVLRRRLHRLPASSRACRLAPAHSSRGPPTPIRDRGVFILSTMHCMSTPYTVSQCMTCACIVQPSIVLRHPHKRQKIVNYSGSFRAIVSETEKGSSSLPSSLAHCSPRRLLFSSLVHCASTTATEPRRTRREGHDAALTFTHPLPTLAAVPVTRRS